MKSTQYKVIATHGVVALCALVVGLWWRPFTSSPHHTEMHVEQNISKRKIAVLLSDSIYYHRKALEGLRAGLIANRRVFDSVEVAYYYARTLDQLIAQQVVKKVIEEKPDVIVPVGASLSRVVVQALKKSNLRTPVVFIGVSRALELELVPSLRPNLGDVTGVGTLGEDSLTPFKILHCLRPDMKRLLLPYCSLMSGQTSERIAEAVKNFFARRGVEVRLMPIDDVADTLDKVHQVIQDFDALAYLEGDRASDSYVGFVKLCNQYGKTLLPLELEALEEGAALAYGVRPAIAGKAVVDYLEKILLDDVSSGSLPVKFLKNTRRLFINPKFMKQQGLNLNPDFIELLENVVLYED